MTYSKLILLGRLLWDMVIKAASMLCFKFKLPRHKINIMGMIIIAPINRNLFIILDWVCWREEEAKEKDFIKPWLKEASSHPFSLVKVRTCEDIRGFLIISWDVKLARNHIDVEAFRVLGVLRKREIRNGLVRFQEQAIPKMITIGVKSFWVREIVNGMLGAWRIQFKAQPPIIAVKVIILIEAEIKKFVSDKLVQGMECLGAHKIIVIIRRE